MAQDDIDIAFKAAAEAGKINGNIICATDAKGRFNYKHVVGERTLLSGEKKPQQLDDVLFLASATKFMTTIAALTCVEDGLLTLTGDLSQVAPELTSKQVLTGFSEQGEPLLEPTIRPITLEMLLAHTSGLNYHFIDPKIGQWREKYTVQGQSPNSNMNLTVEETFTYPLSSQPGDGWMYGPNLDWAGRIVERVTGKTLLERLEERVFRQLGITDAQFYPVTREAMRERMVDLNPNDPEGLGKAVLGGGDNIHKTNKGQFGGHGLFMTAPDYLKVLHSLLANDGKILKPTTVDDMFEDHLGPKATESHNQACESPWGQFFRVGTEAGSKSGHGLGGLLTLQDVEAWYGERTMSWGGGMTFSWFIDRKNDLCGVGAIQAALPMDMQVIADLKQTFRHDVYRKRAEWRARTKV